MSPTVYLVSGANRGIGFALVKALVTRPDVIVFAGARRPDASDELLALSKEHSGKLHIIKLTSADEADNRAAVQEIKKTAGRLDVVIANAGILTWLGTVIEAPLDVMREHFEVNVLGVLALFQATYPLLKESTSTPKFIPISSTVGSVTIGPTLPMLSTPYGASKAATNFMTRKIRAENEGLICFPICPGAVSTNPELQKKLIPEGAPIEIKSADEVAPMILALVDKATRDTDAFTGRDGAVLPW